MSPHRTTLGRALRARAAWTAFVLWTISGCSGGETATTSDATCGIPGQTRVCQDSCDYGTQTCQITGEWTDCVCSDGAHAASGGGNTAGTSAGTSSTSGMGAGSGSAAGSSGTAGTSSTLDAGPDAMPDVDASMALDAALDDAGPMGPQLYERCTKDTKCAAGSMCTRSGLGGSGSGSGFCTKKCTSKADCPPPSSGNATAACGNGGNCQLVCGPTVTCPAGLLCANFGASGICL